MTHDRGRDEAVWGLQPTVRWYTRILLDRYKGLRITSGHRTPKQNRQAGGVATSFHLSGRAVDLAGPADELLAAARQARHAHPVELILSDHGTGYHLHLAW